MQLQSAPSILASEGVSLPFPILTAIIFVPVLGAILVALSGRSRPEITKLIAVLSSVMTAGLSIWLLGAFDTHGAGFQFTSKHEWIEQWGISWNLGVDGISLFLVVLTGVLFPLAIVGIDPHHDEKPYLAWLLMLEAGVMGSFLSLDLFVFFIFFEIVLVPMYFLIGGWGYENRVYAATKFFLYTMFGSAFMLVGLIATAMLARNDLGKITFDLVEIAEGANFAASTGRWLFFAFAIAFAVKVPIFPLHTWLPDAHTQAPTAGSVVLAGVMLKLGTYGFLRFGLYLFPEAAIWSRSLWLTLAVIGIIYGAIAATMQKDLKRLVAYSSVAHLGFIILGTFAVTTQSLSGSVLQMISHGISTGALFLMVGMIYERRKTRQIAELGGIQQVAPIFAAGFMVVMLSSIGVPGLNGFVGEYLILIGSFQTARWWTVVATAGVILAALYLLWAYQRVFHGEPNNDNKTFPELKLKEGLVLLPFLAGILFIGVYPKPLLDRIEPSVNELVVHVQEGANIDPPTIGDQFSEDPGHRDGDGDGHGDVGDGGHGEEDDGDDGGHGDENEGDGDEESHENEGGE
jgi:NADH-quinone oxidoreductase subunit M